MFYENTIGYYLAKEKPDEAKDHQNQGRQNKKPSNFEWKVEERERTCQGNVSV